MAWDKPQLLGSIRSYQCKGKQFVTEYLIHLFQLTSNSSVSKVTGYTLEDRRSVTGRDRDFPFAMTLRPAVEPIQPLIQWEMKGNFLDVKRSEREYHHSPP